MRITSFADEITEYRKQLTELLWDFEDFIEPDTFEAEKFQELQALTREAAPKVYNILITMKVEVPKHLFSHLSPPSSPHPHPLSPVSESTLRHPFGLASSTGGSRSGSQSDARSVADCPHVDDAAAQLQKLMSERRLSGAQSQLPDVASAVQGGEGTSIPLLFERPLQTPPRPPSLDPWDPQSVPAYQETEMDVYGPVAIDRRPTVYRPESPVDPAISPISPDFRRHLPTSAHQPHKSISSIRDQDANEYSGYRYSGFSTQPRPTNATSRGILSQVSTLSPTIAEDDLPQRMSKPTYSIQSLRVRSPSPPPPPPMTSGEVATSGVKDMDRQYRAIRQLQGDPPSPPLNSHERDSGDSRQVTPAPRSQPGLEVTVTVPSEDPDHGLIPVETEDSTVKVAGRLSVKDCAIGPNSTFYQYKGFCEGAKEVLRGEIGVKKTKKPVSSS